MRIFNFAIKNAIWANSWVMKSEKFSPRRRSNILEVKCSDSLQEEWCNSSALQFLKQPFSWVNGYLGENQIRCCSSPCPLFPLEIIRYALGFYFAALLWSPEQCMDCGDNPQGVFCDAPENPFFCTAGWHVLHGQTDSSSDGILHISRNHSGLFSLPSCGSSAGWFRHT